MCLAKTVLAVLLAYSWAIIRAEETEAFYGNLCPRIFTKGLDGGKVAHLQLLGVYVLTNVTWSELPVYKHEQEELYIYIVPEKKILSIGKQGMPRPILYGHLEYLKTELALLGESDEHPYYTAFYDMVDEWYTYDPVNKSYTPLPANDIKLQCVGEDFLLCKSKEMSFMGEIPFEMREVRTDDDAPTSWISDVTDIKFYMFDVGFRNMRPVYEVLGFYNVMYLSYDGEFWELSNDWLGDYAHKSTVFRVRDTALRPEYITGRWQIKQNSTYFDVPNLDLRCRGSKSGPEGACTDYDPCRYASTCKYVEHTDVYGDILCLCGWTRQGRMCEEETPTCSVQESLDMPENALFYSSNGHRLGDVMTYFCSSERKEKFFFSKCQAKTNINGTMETGWVHYGDCLELASAATKLHISLIHVYVIINVITIFINRLL